MAKLVGMLKRNYEGCSKDVPLSNVVKKLREET